MDHRTGISALVVAALATSSAVSAQDAPSLLEHCGSASGLEVGDTVEVRIENPDAERPLRYTGVSMDGYLYQVTSGFFAEDGRIGISNVGSSEVLIFNADGTLSTEVGGAGGGPAEFGRLRRVRIAPEGSWFVATDLTFGVKRFGLQGEHLGGTRIRLPQSFLILDAMPVGRNDVLVLGWGLAHPGRRSTRQTRLIRRTAVVSHYDSTGVSGQVLVEIPTKDSFFMVYDGGASQGSMPIGHTPWMVRIGHSCFAHAVAESADVEIRTATGDLMARLSIPQVDVSLTEREWEQVMDSVVEQSGREGEWDFSSFPPLEARPAWNRAAFDEVQQHLWLEQDHHRTKPARRWLLVDLEDATAQWVEAPPGAKWLLDVEDDRVLLLTTGEFDVEAVQIFRRLR